MNQVQRIFKQVNTRKSIHQIQILNQVLMKFNILEIVCSFTAMNNANIF